MHLALNSKNWLWTCLTTFLFNLMLMIILQYLLELAYQLEFRFKTLLSSKKSYKIMTLHCAEYWNLTYFKQNVKKTIFCWKYFGWFTEKFLLISRISKRCTNSSKRNSKNLNHHYNILIWFEIFSSYIHIRDATTSFWQIIILILTLFETGGLFSPPLRENIHKSKWFFGVQKSMTF